ncbi:VOC family protein [Nocardia sp. NPDC055002]|uniref:VOC family protein n=1 Tax=Nocardia sp. NPDC056952 TaxID=3345979 RepID=UPI00362667F2
MNFVSASARLWLPARYRWSLGATRVTDAVGEDRFRVFRDPAGHTFCLGWGITAGDT